MERTWLKQIRINKGLEQKEIAKKIGKSQVCYYYIESGQRNPSVELAQKIADVLEFEWTMFYPRKKKRTK